MFNISYDNDTSPGCNYKLNYACGKHGLCKKYWITRVRTSLFSCYATSVNTKLPRVLQNIDHSPLSIFRFIYFERFKTIIKYISDATFPSIIIQCVFVEDEKISRISALVDFKGSCSYKTLLRAILTNFNYSLKNYIKESKQNFDTIKHTPATIIPLYSISRVFKFFLRGLIQ